MIRYLKSAILALLTVTVMFQSEAMADYIEPGTIKVGLVSSKPVLSTLPTGKYYYEVAWQGIPVGEAGVEVFKEDNNMKVLASAKSGRVIDLVYTLRHTSESEFSLNTFQPLKFHIEQTENSKLKKVEVDFPSPGLIKSFIEKNGKKEEVREFFSEDEIRDPISAAFLARSINVEIGKEASFQIYNGKHRYLITFLPEAVEKIKILNVERDAYKISPSIKKLTDSDGEKRFRKGTIWMAVDETRDILKMESEVLVGSVRATLKAYNQQGTEVTPDVSLVRARLK